MFDKANIVGEKFPNFIALMVSVSFVISFLYNYAFISGLDLSFSKIPISVIDITNSTIKFSLFFLIAFLIGVGIGHFTKSNDEQEQLNKSDNFSIKDLMKDCLYLILIVLGIFVYGLRIDAIAILIIFLLFKIQKYFSGVVAFILGIILLSLTVGYSSGLIKRDANYYNADIKLIQGSDIKVLIIYNLDKGVLYKINQEIKFSPWNDIKEIKYKISPIYKGYICKKYNLCFQNTK